MGHCCSHFKPMVSRRRFGLALFAAPPVLRILHLHLNWAPLGGALGASSAKHMSVVRCLRGERGDRLNERLRRQSMFPPLFPSARSSPYSSRPAMMVAFLLRRVELSLGGTLLQESSPLTGSTSLCPPLVQVVDLGSCSSWLLVPLPPFLMLLMELGRNIAIDWDIRSGSDAKLNGVLARVSFISHF